MTYPEVVSYKQKLAQLKSEEKSTARPNALSPALSIDNVPNSHDGGIVR